MSSNETDKKRAIEQFEEAFERLKKGRTKILPAGAPLTLTNVAREAGRSPSALRADRYPELIQRIKSRMLLEREATRVKTSDRKKSHRSRQIKEQLADCMRERGRLVSICHSQQTLIDELRDQLLLLEQGKKPLCLPDCGGTKT